MTTTGPVVAPIGTDVVMPSVVAVRTSAGTPLLATARSPSGPLVIVVSGAVLSTITERAVAVDSLPATSVTFTDRVCAPSAAVVVSQTASAVTIVAGAAGLSVTESG